MVRKGFKNLAIEMAVIMMLSQSFPALALENTEGHWQKEDGQQVAGVSRSIPEVLGVNRSSSGGYGRSSGGRLGSGSGNVSAESSDQQSQLQKQKEEAEKKGKMQRRKPKKKGRKKSRKRKIKKRKSKKSRKKRKTFPYWKESIAD